jgi:glutamate carboxypeptidase
VWFGRCCESRENRDIVFCEGVLMRVVDGLLEMIRGQQAEMLRFLSELVLAESPSPEAQAQAVPLALLREALVDLGFEVLLLPGESSGGQLLARPAVGSPWAAAETQLLLGHCDTVWPRGTLQEMPLLIEENVVRGPGVFDMKGGLTQMIFALRALRALGLKPALMPLVFVNSDEEIGSLESRALIEQLAQEAQRAFILEPALGPEGMLKTARKGVGHFELRVHGRAAHAGLDPEKGVSAILAMALLVQELHNLTDLQNGISVNVGTIEGGLRSNVIAPQSRATIDARAQTVADAQRLEQQILNLASPLAGVTVEVSGGFNRQPLERTERNQALWRRAEAAGRELGLTLQQGSAGGGSDGNFTSQFTATLDGLGPVGDGAHARHEFLLIDKMLERTALLALLLLEPG